MLKIPPGINSIIVNYIVDVINTLNLQKLLIENKQAGIVKSEFINETDVEEASSTLEMNKQRVFFN